MKTMHLKVIILCLLVISCDTLTSKKVDQETTVTNTITISGLKSFEKKVIYTPKNIKVLDSTLYQNKTFLAFKSSFDHLNGLDPNDLGLFLNATLTRTNKLLEATLSDNFEVPAVKSRLRVVKTQLLRSIYFSKEQDIKALNFALDDLFDSYNVFLKRIDDIALNEGVLSESEFDVGKKTDKIVLE